MTKRVFVIHGWHGNPNEAMLSWIGKSLQVNNFRVFSPNMPDPDVPKIGAWVGKLGEIVNNCDKDTYFVGHSIGCQTILRYLEQKSVKQVGGVVLIAPWFNLTAETFEEDSEEVARPWIDTKIDFKEIKGKLDKLVCIFSDDDPYVPLTDAEIFEKELGAKIIVENNKGHFTEEDDVRDCKVALKEMLLISK